MSQLTGKCYCGQIQFTITPPLRMVSHCHCQSCRRSHGAAFVTWTSIENERFKITSGADLLAGYESSPGIVWKFCKNCGSSIFQTTRHTPHITYVVAAALNEPLDRRPEGHFSFEERVPWLDVVDDLPKFHAKTSDLIRHQDAKK